LCAVEPQLRQAAGTLTASGGQRSGKMAARIKKIEIRNNKKRNGNIDTSTKRKIFECFRKGV
jgi:hypothetical protein